MKNKVMRLVAAFALVVGGLGAAHFAAPQAAASGDCSAAYVQFYGTGDLSGVGWRYCLGINDTNTETETTSTPLGPLAGGGYANDFDNIESASGISSFYFFDAAGGTNYGVCLYYGSGYNTVLGWAGDTGGYAISAVGNNAMGSFKFTTNVSQLGC